MCACMLDRMVPMAGLFLDSFIGGASTAMHSQVINIEIRDIISSVYVQIILSMHNKGHHHGDDL